MLLRWQSPWESVQVAARKEVLSMTLKASTNKTTCSSSGSSSRMGKIRVPPSLTSDLARRKGTMTMMMTTMRKWSKGRPLNRGALKLTLTTIRRLMIMAQQRSPWITGRPNNLFLEIKNKVRPPWRDARQREGPELEASKQGNFLHCTKMKIVVAQQCIQTLMRKAKTVGESRPLMADIMTIPMMARVIH
jgi:hypothetical protein